ncbi:hypothetical protein [Pseudoalteromonas piscicida]|uniref:Alginate export domain-containing protein n=1 Tax=Pseudoalteromonas piscicida TaxID=43662 RepID=A0AAD0RLE7_PSEO7|nr:hypothetical protein [Pseudoalteromonas piscicida]ASD65691.1 hypothetical protein B1L02_00600 [Pseudoalteromonas piscicida]AXQ96445.1 hypothetical protein D0N37_00590 [Pseudoalteromonas piscicida]AXR00728.1 hypothetical protein D0511_00600 [Pseudoalteromonas piscicida]
MTSMITKLSAALALFVMGQTGAVEISGQGQLQTTWQHDDNHKAWYQPGWGVTRFGKGESDITLSRGAIDWRVDFSSAWSLHGVTQYVSDPDDKLGFTELYLQYRTLPKNGRRVIVRAGGFYPKFSVENPDIGWSSPYTYQYSAINAWIGEEVRVFGGEVAIEQPKTHRSRGQGFKGVFGVFKGNDPAGTLLAWRGFTVHDRQSVFNESLPFAAVESLNTPQLQLQAQHVEPFSEVDGRFGYYVGYHRDFSNRSKINVYWYDNNGDPSKINYRIGQYAWDTKFISAAWRYKLTLKTQLLIQGMAGSTAMGGNRGVDIDFNSWFLLLSHKFDDWRFSVRAEQFKVIDKDDWQFDPNQSDGHALTAAVKCQINSSWLVGGELLNLTTTVANREAFNGKPKQTDNVWRLSAEYRFNL